MIAPEGLMIIQTGWRGVLLLSLLFLLVAGCDCTGVVTTMPPDASDVTDDAGAATFDAGIPDAGTPDAGPVDAGEVDAGEPDAGATDAGEPDAGDLDAGVDDGGTSVLPPDAGPLTCWSCHGTLLNPAPPKDTQGLTDRTARTVGAHQEHLRAGLRWHRLIACDDCHRVPATVEEPGHLDPSPAELTFGAVPNADNVTSRFDGATCTTYCHGVSLGGGSHTQPNWMTDPPAACGQCHGLPPPPPHPPATLSQCQNCHLDLETEPQRHIDGILDFKSGCATCHGDGTSPAPPNDTLGNTATTARGVGAHRSHLGPSTWHAEIGCDDCHVVPTRYDDPGHFDTSLPAEVNITGTGAAGGATPSWNGVTCSNYCHGQFDGGANFTPQWTRVDGTQAACGTCHTTPPTAGHPLNSNCSQCHGTVVGADGGFVNAALHINGQVDGTYACGSCHALPPATGTHLLHAGTQGARVYGSLSTAASVTSPTGYAFGCGQCHPLDSRKHMNGGLAEVELYDPNAPAGSLKSRSPLATYTPGSTVFTDDAGVTYTQGTCGNVYCHSGPSVATPSGVPRPGVDFTFAGYPITYPTFSLVVGRSFQNVAWGGTVNGCAGCHGLPIRTTDSTVKAMAGQSHSFIGSTGLESGHANNHNDNPLSCRVCHFDTVKAANAVGRVNGLSTYGPVPIVGFAQHVNGGPDVAFDTVDSVSSAGRVQNLSTAAFSQTTRTCSNVSCHASQTAVVNGHPFRPDQVSPECNVCHQY